MSMAIRYDHTLGIPGYYDSLNTMFDNRSGGERLRPTRAMRLASTLEQMRQMWEEVMGYGFYSPDREAHYASMCEGVEAVAEADRKTLMAGNKV
jgi:hypothetical protein